MSMFENVAGRYPLASELMAILIRGHEWDLDEARNAFQRIRDVYPGNEGHEIVVFTRTGGGNRVEFGESNTKIAALKGYISDEDDEFDRTYAHWRFETPAFAKEWLKEFLATAIAEHGVERVMEKPMDRFRRRTEEIRSSVGMGRAV